MPFLFASLIFGNTWGLVVVAIVAVLVTWLLWRSYAARTGLSRFEAAVCSICKLVGCLMLALCFAEPGWSSFRVRPRENVVLVAVDSSRSMTRTDPGSSASRLELSKKLLSAPWLDELKSDFEVRMFGFDRRPAVTHDVQQLKGEGWYSNLHFSLAELQSRFRQQTVAGLILFSDGNATDEEPEFDPGLGKAPVYPVNVFPPQLARKQFDLAIDRVQVSSTAFEDAPTTITAEVRRTDSATGPVLVEVLDEESKVCGTQTIAVGGPEVVTVRFQIRPLRQGISFYQVRCSLSEEAGEWPKGKEGLKPGADFVAKTKEETWLNNTWWTAVDRGKGAYRILYLSGRPNWEYKFLKRSVTDDDQLDLTAVIRIAKREPKFDWRSRAGENSNPLFRGFGQDEAESERYDQPVLVRLNTKHPDEFRDGFPTKPEDLFSFSGIILDDVEAEFLTAEQQVLIERFVSERGGSLMMLGGTESFADGKYARTPVGRMLPVYLDGPLPDANGDEPATSSKLMPNGSDNTPTSGEGFRLRLTKEGWLQPWARLRRTEQEENVRLGELPVMTTRNIAGRIKPGAMAVLETVDARGSATPAFVWHRFGQGRVAAMLVGDLWRWPLEQTDDQRKTGDSAKAWRQLLRNWIVDVPRVWDAKLRSREDSPQGAVVVDVRLRGPDFEALENGTVKGELITAQGTRPVVADPSAEEIGLFHVEVARGEPGLMRVKLQAFNEQNEDMGETEVGWVEQPAAEEWRHIEPNVPQLERIASRTKGRVVAPHELGRLREEFAAKSELHREQQVTSVWHSPWWLMTIVLCLSTEWGWRRFRGLP